MKPPTAYWPGTNVPKSTTGPFNWRRTDHADMSPVIRDDHGMRTPLFNQWLAARHARPDTTADWPAWRDAHQQRQRPAPSKRQPGGFAHHNGTIPGMGREAKLLAARPAAPGTMSGAKAMAKPASLMPIAGHALQHGQVTAPHRSRRRVPRGGAKKAVA